MPVTVHVAAARFTAPPERMTSMKILANAMAHPRTSVAGILIGIASVSSVFSQQGITLGKVGSATVVSLVTAMASTLLGLLARDPGATPATVPVRKDQ